jgi:hypothetical protein
VKQCAPDFAFLCLSRSVELLEQKELNTEIRSVRAAIKGCIASFTQSVTMRVDQTSYQRRRANALMVNGGPCLQASLVRSSDRSSAARDGSEAALLSFAFGCL